VPSAKAQSDTPARTGAIRELVELAPKAKARWAPSAAFRRRRLRCWWTIVIRTSCRSFGTMAWRARCAC